jgi:hypothetical protein
MSLPMNRSSDSPVVEPSTMSVRVTFATKKTVPAARNAGSEREGVLTDVERHLPRALALDDVGQDGCGHLNDDRCGGTVGDEGRDGEGGGRGEVFNLAPLAWDRYGEHLAKREQQGEEPEPASARGVGEARAGRPRPDEDSGTCHGDQQDIDVDESDLAGHMGEYSATNGPDPRARWRILPDLHGLFGHGDIPAGRMRYWGGAPHPPEPTIRKPEPFRL